MQSNLCRDESSKTSSFRKGGSGQLSTKVALGKTKYCYSTIQYVHGYRPDFIRTLSF